jgi:hypothetical protein
MPMKAFRISDSYDSVLIRYSPIRLEMIGVEEDAGKTWEIGPRARGPSSDRISKQVSTASLAYELEHWK